MPTATAPPSAIAALWARLSARTGTAEALAAFMGMPPAAARAVVGAALASSDEVEELLDGMSATVRSLSIATTVKAERCHGEIRGPVLWSETMSARSASAGDTGLYVCALPAKAYDTLENQVLAAALAAVVRAGRDADQQAEGGHDDELVRRARANGQRAARWLDHRTLASVSRDRPDGRALRRARAGNKRRVYRPAVAVVDRSERPLSAADVEARADARSQADLDLFASLLDRLERRRGGSPGPLVAEHGWLRCGPLAYRRPAGDDDLLAGVQVGDVLVGVAAPGGDDEVSLARRAGDRPHVLVTDVADVDRALDRAGIPPA